LLLFFFPFEIMAIATNRIISNISAMAIPFPAYDQPLFVLSATAG
jgi:hypothetical protein